MSASPRRTLSQRWLYLANARVPSEKAHAYQILQMCDALQLEGAAVQLVYPRRANIERMREVNDITAYYGVTNKPALRETFTVDLVKLVTLDQPWLNRPTLAIAAHHLQTLTFAVAAAAYARTSGRAAGVWYARDWPVLLACVLLGAGATPGCGDRGRRVAVSPCRHVAMSPCPPRPQPPLMIWEAHDFPAGGVAQRAVGLLLRQLDGVVAISRGLGERIVAAGLPPERLLIAPDAVDPERFRCMPSREEARRTLGLPENDQIVGYAGHLYRWKGVYTLADASAHLLDGTRVLVVGGTEADVAALRVYVRRRGLARVVLTGHVPPDRVPLYLAAADALVLPNSAEAEISRRYTSPLKLFEYAAGRRPIVASDLPALRELLCHGESALLVQPDSPTELAAGIQRVLDDPALAARLVDGASRALGKHTWRARARHILGFVSTLTPR